jgi:hypothetical protein
MEIGVKEMLKGADAYVIRVSLDWVELLSEIRRFAESPADNKK